MLIDRYLPRFDVASRHHVRVRAPIPIVYRAARELDFSDCTTTRWLFRLRGLPATALRLEGLLRFGFIFLGETSDDELVLGLVGRFWSVSGDLQRLAADEFIEFSTPGYAKVVWNFSVREQPDGTTRLETRTRVRCLDDRSRRRFRAYWTVVGPFSGWIRRDILRAVRRRAESDVASRGAAAGRVDSGGAE